MPSFPFDISWSQIPFYIMLLGALIMALLCIVFFWSFAEYIFFKGDDAERAHAKVQLLTASASLFLLMILWVIFDWAAGFFGI